MNAGAGDQGVTGPASVSGKRGPVKKGADYWFQFYRCPCGAYPFSQQGIVKVEHALWCPTRVLKETAQR